MYPSTTLAQALSVLEKLKYCPEWTSNNTWTPPQPKMCLCRYDDLLRPCLPKETCEGETDEVVVERTVLHERSQDWKITHVRVPERGPKPLPAFLYTLEVRLTDEVEVLRCSTYTWETTPNFLPLPSSPVPEPESRRFCDGPPPPMMREIGTALGKIVWKTREPALSFTEKQARWHQEKAEAVRSLLERREREQREKVEREQRRARLRARGQARFGGGQKFGVTWSDPTYGEDPVYPRRVL